MTKVVPIFVAVMVWLIRVLIIGAFSVAGDKLFSFADDHPNSRPTRRPTSKPKTSPVPTFERPIPKPLSASARRRSSRTEPSYHPIGMSAQAHDERQGMRRQ